MLNVFELVVDCGVQMDDDNRDCDDNGDGVNAFVECWLEYAMASIAAA